MYFTVSIQGLDTLATQIMGMREPCAKWLDQTCKHRASQNGSRPSDERKNSKLLVENFCPPLLRKSKLRIYATDFD
jgi:hypothetical protein